MVYHTVAFKLGDQNVTDKEALVIPDDVMTRSGDTRFIVLAGFDRIHQFYVSGPLVQEAKIFTPSLETRKQILRALALNSAGRTLDPAKLPVNRFTPPIPVTPSEELSVKLTLGPSASAQTHYAIIDLGPDTIPPPPAGERRWIRLEASTTLRPGEWTSVRLTPEIQLDVGTYTLTNFICIAQTLIACRPILRGQLARPGKIGFAGSEANARAYFQSLLKISPSYALGTFTHLAIPEFQFLSHDADTNQVVYAEIIKTG